MKIVVPENMGSDLRVLPEGSYDAEFSDLFLGQSQTQKPKMTVKYVITSEYDGPKTDNFKTTIGEPVIETFSLQPQAMFNLNGLYKAVTDKDIPAREYTDEEFAAFIKEALAGARFKLLLTVGSNNGKERTEVSDRKYVPRKSKLGGAKK